MVFQYGNLREKIIAAINGLKQIFEKLRRKNHVKGRVKAGWVY